MTVLVSAINFLVLTTITAPVCRAVITELSLSTALVLVLTLAVIRSIVTHNWDGISYQLASPPRMNIEQLINNS